MTTVEKDQALRSVRDRARALPWLGLAVGCLLLSGTLAAGLVVARVPPLSYLVTDPTFFKRCLVIHVDLAIVVWFHAFAAALFALVPTRVAPNPLGQRSSVLGALGVLALIACAAIPARPILANYVPLLDSRVFRFGLAVVGAGVLANVLDPKLLPWREAEHGAVSMPGAARVGLRAGAISLLMAAATFLGAGSTVPEGLPLDSHWELVLWGGGHILQWASVCAMLAAWAMLLEPVAGEIVSRRAAGWIFGGLCIAPVIAPALALAGAGTSLYHAGFTRLMQFGIAPFVLAFLWLTARALRRAPAPRRALLRDVRVTGFLASAGLTLAGFVLGALIRGPDTRIPAHYHASIGGVTVAFMALTAPLLSALGLPAPAGRLARWLPAQPALLAGGQLVFSAGFALAGARRKAYGGEQEVRGLLELLGLGTMGLGGLFALLGGVLYLAVVVQVAARHAAYQLRASTARAAGGAPKSLPAESFGSAGGRISPP